MNLSPTILLFAFYLFVLLQWKYVKRPMFYFIGIAALLFAMFGGLFPIISGKVRIVGDIFAWIGNLVALAAAVGACCGADLPIKVPGVPAEAEAEKPASE
jgi:hypothetical protein